VFRLHTCAHAIHPTVSHTSKRELAWLYHSRFLSLFLCTGYPADCCIIAIARATKRACKLRINNAHLSTAVLSGCSWHLSIYPVLMEWLPQLTGTSRTDVERVLCRRAAWSCMVRTRKESHWFYWSSTLVDLLSCLLDYLLLAHLLACSLTLQNCRRETKCLSTRACASYLCGSVVWSLPQPYSRLMCVRVIACLADAQ